MEDIRLAAAGKQERSQDTIVVDISRGTHVWEDVRTYVHQDLLGDDQVGPVTVHPGERPLESLLMLNGWWFMQVLPEHVASGLATGGAVPMPTLSHARWLLAGIRSGGASEAAKAANDVAADPTAATSLYSVWRNQRLSPRAARLLIYIPLYVEGILRNPKARAAYMQLHKMRAAGKKLVIHDGCDAVDLCQLVSASQLGPAPVLRALLYNRLLAEMRTAAASLGIGPLSPSALPPDLRPLQDDEKIPGLIGGAVVYYRQAFLNRMADRYFELLRPGGAAKIPWERRNLIMFGKEVQEGHDTAFFGDPGTSYRYTGTNHATLPWSADPTGALAELRDMAQLVTGCPFNLALLNFYTPKCSIGAHSDDERDLVVGSPIFSFSVGRSRLFQLIPRGGSGARGATVMRRLPHGSAIVMAGLTQKAYKHCVEAEKMRPAEKDGPEDRVNITLRCVVRR